jgi:3-dehydroquinate synthase
VSALDVVPVALGERSYDIVVGPGAIDRLAEVVAGRRRAVIVTQDAVEPHVAVVRAALDRASVAHGTVAMGDGEAVKSLTTIDALCGKFARQGLLRGDVVVAVGGGVVGDTAGFAAAIYHRGVALVQVPTTLLAMVDSAIGGKTAVNLPEGKNLVGAFHQPLAVLSDPDVLRSLPDREYRCGLGEVAKYALMGDAVLVDVIFDDAAALLARDASILREVITRSAAIKARYVSADECETTGVRAELNYGHTLAHAIETVSANALAHGEAVAVGLIFAGELAGALERISPVATARHADIVATLGLPVRVPDGLARAALVELMRRDKKAAGGLTFVLQGPNGLERVDDPPAAAIDTALAAVGVRE